MNFIIACIVGLAFGVLALCLPYRYNPFRFRRFLASAVSDKTNRAVPRIIGIVLIVFSGLPLLAIGGLALLGGALKNESMSNESTAELSDLAKVALIQDTVQSADAFRMFALNVDTQKYERIAVQGRGGSLVAVKKLIKSAVQPREMYGRYFDSSNSFSCSRFSR